MPYKTISIKLLKPTASKKRILDDALERYTRSFALLLERVRPELPPTPFSQSFCMRLLGQEYMKLVNELDAQPFKDSLKLDLAMLLTLWSRQRKTYPVVRTDDQALKQALESEAPVSTKELDGLLNKYGRVRPVMFCRHDPARDYSLLQDPATGRFYAKLYLFNRQGAVSRQEDADIGLQYLPPPHEELSSPTKVRYVLFPLEAGDWQAEHLRHIGVGGAEPKSALLLRKGKDYYLNLRLWYPPVPQIEGQSFLGVCRGAGELLFYAVCSPSGAVLESGPINSNAPQGKLRQHGLANRVVALASRHKSTLVLENLVGTGDGLPQPGFNPPLSAGEYNSICDFIAYKAELAGLPQPVRVSPRRIYQRCPVCGVTRKANRYQNDALLCVSCAAFRPVAYAAAINLATTLLRYEASKLTVAYSPTKQGIVFHMDSLGITYTCAEGLFAVPNFCAHLREWLQTPQKKLTRQQASICKKLESCSDLQDYLAFEKR